MKVLVALSLAATLVFAASAAAAYAYTAFQALAPLAAAISGATSK